MQILKILLFSFLVGVSPMTLAQGIDIPDTETPDGGGDEEFPGGDFGCGVCCGAASTDFERAMCKAQYPGCICGISMPSSPSCVSTMAMQSSTYSLVDRVNISFEIWEMWKTLASLEGGEEFNKLYLDNDWRLLKLVAGNKKLTSDFANFVGQNRGALRGMVDGKGTVTKTQLVEFKRLLTQIAVADKKVNDGAFGKAIEKTVIPRIKPVYVGMPYDEALKCFLKDSCALEPQ